MNIEEVFTRIVKLREELYRGRIHNFALGEHKSPFKGVGFDIHDFREWHRGEPLENIDWAISMPEWPHKVYAVEKLEPRMAPVVAVVDLSPSMFVSFSPEKNKFLLLLELLGLLGLTAQHFQDPFGMIAFSDHVPKFNVRPKLGKGQLFHVLQILLEEEDERTLENKVATSRQQDFAKTFNDALGFVFQQIRLQGTIVILSDFVDAVNDPSALNYDLLEQLSVKHGFNVVAVCLEDSYELDWRGFFGTVMVRDSEVMRMREVKVRHARKIRAEFVQKREELRKRLKKECQIDSVVLSYGEHVKDFGIFCSERKAGC